MGPGPGFEGVLARERKLYPFKKSLEPAEAAAWREGATLTDDDWAELQGLYLVGIYLFFIYLLLYTFYYIPFISSISPVLVTTINCTAYFSCLVLDHLLF